MQFAPNFFANPTSMEYAKILVRNFLLRTFEDVTKTFSYLDNLDTTDPSTSGSRQDVLFTFSVPEQHRLTAEDITVRDNQDKVATVTFEIPSTIMHDGFDIIKNHTQWMIATGSPEMAITNSDGQITDNFELIPDKNRKISFLFKPRLFLRDKLGAFNFNLFIHYALCVVLFTAPQGIIRQGYYLVELAYKNIGLCDVCFGKNKTPEGRPACKRGEDCPFIGCCKLCWEEIPIHVDVYPRDHILNDCAVFKELLAKQEPQHPTSTS